MSRRPHSDSPLWIDWRLPNGRSGKLGPFFGTAAASAAAELGERQKSMERLTQREPRQWVVTELRLSKAVGPDSAAGCSGVAASHEGGYGTRNWTLGLEGRARGRGEKRERYVEVSSSKIEVDSARSSTEFVDTSEHLTTSRVMLRSWRGTLPGRLR
jgi:hypothetical protein